MTPDVISVQALPNYTLLLTFENCEKKIFDVKPLIETRNIFKELEDIRLFNTVKAWEGTVQWKNEQDISPEWLYEDGVDYTE